MKKKVLYLITKSNWGGAQRYVYDLATNLGEDFESVVALGGVDDEDSSSMPVPKVTADVELARQAVGGAGLLKKKLEEAGVRTIPVSGLQRDISLSKELNSFGELVKICKKEKPDVLHVNSSKAGGLGVFAGRIAGVKKIVFTAHGWPHEEPRPFFQKALVYFFSWLTALLSHKVIVVSGHDLKTARSMLGIGRKTTLIYNGIDENSAFGSGDVIRNAFPKGAHIVGTIGELTRNKNQIALMERAKREPGLFIAIVGEGEDRPYLEKKIEEYGLTERVKLFGFQPADEVLKGFDLFALPSLKEGLPYVLLEAKAAGLAIEANRVGGVDEILDAKDVSEFSLKEMLEKTINLYRA